MVWNHQAKFDLDDAKDAYYKASNEVDRAYTSMTYEKYKSSFKSIRPMWNAIRIT